MNPQPLWQQIATTLSDGFDADRLPPGARLPSEAELAQRFDVNRHTVRRAIEALVRAGRVRVERGRGAFIADDLLDYEISARTRFSERIRRQNRVPDGETLRLREIEGPLEATAALGLPDAAPLIHLERLGRADRIPISLADHYFAADRLPGLADALRTVGSITDALRQIGIDDYVRHSTRVTARLPTPIEADRLEIPKTRPLLVCENLNVDRNGRPIEFALTRHPSTRVQLVFEP